MTIHDSQRWKYLSHSFTSHAAFEFAVLLSPRNRLLYIDCYRMPIGSEYMPRREAVLLTACHVPVRVSPTIWLKALTVTPTIGSGYHAVDCLCLLGSQAFGRHVQTKRVTAIAVNFAFALVRAAQHSLRPKTLATYPALRDVVWEVEVSPQGKGGSLLCEA